MKDNNKPTPWAWVPTLYFAEGIPYVVVMTVAVIMYKRLGLSNTDVALYTSWLYLPWVIKPFWSPFVDLLRSKRWWIVAMQLLIGAAMAAVAFFIPVPDAIQVTLALFWLMAFSSATHDIAADGFYMLALDEEKQAFFVGIRSTFYRIAMISGQGLLVMLAGWLEGTMGNVAAAWSATFGVVAALFLAMALYHRVVLPRPAVDAMAAVSSVRKITADFVDTFADFFRKPRIGIYIAFMLLYRLAEALLVKMSSPFLIDAREVGGMGLSTSQVGFVYGTVGVIALTLGGILGGIAVARKGLKFWLWPMALAITLPNAVYLYMAMALPDSFVVVNAAVAVEQFGYGFGFTAYMLYLIKIAEGRHSTAHYSLCTGFMALGMMLPGMVAGWIQEAVGYQMFFVVVMICTLPTLLLIPFLRK